MRAHLRMVGIIVIGGAMAVSVAAQAQSGGAWFGLKLPPGLGDPHKPIVEVSGVKTPPVTVPAGEEKFQDLSGPRIYKDLEAIVGFSKASRQAGDKVWGRISGFPGAAATAKWVVEQFTAAGLKDVQLQPIWASAPMWWAKGWEVKLLGDPKFGAGTADVVLASALPTGGSQISGTLTAPLVYVGALDAPITADVKGKVAVQDVNPTRGAFSERGPTTTRARELTKLGAVAVINSVNQVANMHIRDFANCGGPCFNLGAADGAFLKAAMERAAKAGAELRVQMTLDGGMQNGLMAHNVVGTVPGKSDEVVIVNAHLDGYFDAAGDNGDGLAVQQAMARHFARPENQPARTLVFVASAGHHSAGLNGPTHFVKTNGWITAKTVLVLNLEHVAQYFIRPDSFKVEATEQPMSFGIDNQAPFLLALGKTAMQRYGMKLNEPFGPGVPGDLGGYGPVGAPRVQAIHSGPMYHTSGDVLETISVNGLERAARFFTYFITEVAKAPKADLMVK